MNPVGRSFVEPNVPTAPPPVGTDALLDPAPKTASPEVVRRAALARAFPSKSPTPLPPWLRGLDDPPSDSIRID